MQFSRDPLDGRAWKVQRQFLHATPLKCFVCQAEGATSPNFALEIGLAF